MNKNLLVFFFFACPSSIFCMENEPTDYEKTRAEQRQKIDKLKQGLQQTSLPKPTNGPKSMSRIAQTRTGGSRPANTDRLKNLSGLKEEVNKELTAARKILAQQLQTQEGGSKGLGEQHLQKIEQSIAELSSNLTVVSEGPAELEAPMTEETRRIIRQEIDGIKEFLKDSRSDIDNPFAAEMAPKILATFLTAIEARDLETTYDKLDSFMDNYSDPLPLTFKEKMLILAKAKTKAKLDDKCLYQAMVASLSTRTNTNPLVINNNSSLDEYKNNFSTSSNIAEILKLAYNAK